VARFWLDRGVDGFRLDDINFGMHDPSLTDNPPAPPGGKRTRPFDFQLHLHNQSQPGLIDFMKRIRALTDAYPGRFTVTEIAGEGAEAEMQAFTEGADRLNSAYGFNYLYADALTPDLVRRAAAAWDGRDGQGWPSWTFSNHDAPRAASRWAHGRDARDVAEVSMLLLMCLRGTAIVYQGEEMGLPQGEVPFERLVDPEAIANWPETLGRDGARTPMPWRSEAQFAGFSTVEPWLPVDARHPALAVDRQSGDANSMLATTRRLIAARRATACLRMGNMKVIHADNAVLVFERTLGAERRLCAFNLGFAPCDWAAPEGWTVVESVGAREADGLPALSGRILAPA